MEQSRALNKIIDLTKQKKIGTILDLDFSRKYMRLQDIKKNLGNVKK